MTDERSALRRKRMVEQSLDLLCVADVDGYFKELNARWTEVLGWTPAELMSVPYFDFVHPDDRAATLREAARLQGRRYTIGFENRYQHKDGGWIWLQWTARVDDELGEIVAAAREVTGSKRQLRMFEQSLDLLCVAGMDGSFHELSPRWADILGIPLAEMIGRPFWEFAHPKDVGRTIREAKRLERGEIEESIGFENRYRRKDGSWVWLQWNSRIDPELGELIAVARDVTETRRVARELARAKEEAETASRAKSRFMANMSHELRTPLNSILGFTAILRRRIEEPAQAQLLERIHGAGRHLLSIINDVLDLAKLESGQAHLELEDVDVAAIVSDVVRTLAVQAAAKELVLARRGDDRPAEVRGHALALRQALLNLVGNAVKFTDVGGVEVRVVRDDAGPLRVDVIDTGPGVPADLRELVFEEFRQADESSARSFSGTGLGLAIARRLARAMGFEVHLVSTPGEGSTFSLVFRGEAPAEHAAPGVGKVPTAR